MRPSLRFWLSGALYALSVHFGSGIVHGQATGSFVPNDYYAHQTYQKPVHVPAMSSGLEYTPRWLVDPTAVSYYPASDSVIWVEKPRDSHHVFFLPLAFFFGRPPGAVVALCATTHGKT